MDIDFLGRGLASLFEVRLVLSSSTHIMSPTFYYFLHVTSILLLTAGTFYAFAAPAETRKRLLMLTGIASLLALIGGFGLLAKVWSNQFHLWVIIKLVCWLGLSALTGLAYRRRAQVGTWAALAIGFVVVGAASAYFKFGM